MAKPSGQGPRFDRQQGRPPRPDGTKQRILHAAAELIAEMGWGVVTTRAVAERAGVLHGVVGYHFDGKADLLRQAATLGVSELFAEPTTLLFAATTLGEGLRAVADWLEGREESLAPFSLVAETMLAARRDAELGSLIAGMIRDFRATLTGSFGDDDAPASADAAVVAALLDGLILHRLLDESFDPKAALRRAADLLEGAGTTATGARRRR